nr:hypothetical protein Ade03nite_66870 [Actinoplanes derwentensis]
MAGHRQTTPFRDSRPGERRITDARLAGLDFFEAGALGLDRGVAAVTGVGGQDRAGHHAVIDADAGHSTTTERSTG